MSLAPTAPVVSSRRHRARFLAGCAVASSAIVALWGLSQWLVPRPDACDRLRDDAFYEFAWAANVAAGRGPSVSDGVTTSGVQLLWSLLLVPIAWLGGAACLPFVAPWLGVALHAATAFGWWRTVRDRATAAGRSSVRRQWCGCRGERRRRGGRYGGRTEVRYTGAQR